MNLLFITATLFFGLYAGGQAIDTHRQRIRIRDVRFTHVTQLDGPELDSCTARLKGQTYEGEKWLDEVAERARIWCWQERGYFRAAVSSMAEEYSRDEYTVVLSVIEGPQYRLGHIAFKNVKSMLSTDRLRSLVPLRDGDIFNSGKIKEGEENLRKAYETLGFIAFTSTAYPEVEDGQRIINIRWDVNEGQTYAVRTIRFDGVPPAVEDSLRSQLLLKDGDIYNGQLLEKSLAQMKGFLPARTRLDVGFISDNKLNVLDIHIRCVSEASQK